MGRERPEWRGGGGERAGSAGSLSRPGWPLCPPRSARGRSGPRCPRRRHSRSIAGPRPPPTGQARRCEPGPACNTARPARAPPAARTEGCSHLTGQRGKLISVCVLARFLACLNHCYESRGTRKPLQTSFLLKEWKRAEKGEGCDVQRCILFGDSRAIKGWAETGWLPWKHDSSRRSAFHPKSWPTSTPKTWLSPQGGTKPFASRAKTLIQV